MWENIRPLSPSLAIWGRNSEAFKAIFTQTLRAISTSWNGTITRTKWWLAVMYIRWGKGKESTRRSGREYRGDRTQDEWNELVDWWSHPNRVSRSLQNAANRAITRINPFKGKIIRAREERIKVEKGHYEDLIETWRKGHSSKKTGEFKTEQNKQRYFDKKAKQEMIKAGIIPFKTDQEILDEVMTQILRQQEQEKELYRKQAEEAQARAYLASLKADAADQRANVAYQNTESIYGALAQRPHYTLLTNPHMNDSRSCDQLAQDLARKNNNECSSREEEEGEQQLGDDYSEEEE
ncbi:hypothetical protein Tco_0925244 [Tanacetum coccineum]|uniref:Uncharacterized protein n=1 Tax=Tanacetum coccineum TaxID=301880 RepID=A0ABQ5D7J8_9ASTR